MTEPAGQLRRRLRKLLRPLLNTPLHPQWLAFREVRTRNTWVAGHAKGCTLDIGCSDGSIKASLPHVDNYVGLDYPGTAIEMYRTRPDVFGDASCLPFVGDAFDTVLLLDVLEHLAEPEMALNEARRVLSEGGQLLLSVPFAYPLHDVPHDYQRFTEYGLRRRLAKAGFSECSVQESVMGVEAAAINLNLALTQSVIDAIRMRDWRVMFAPAIMVFIPAINILGWLSAWILPARRLFPKAYYVRARA